MEDSVVLTAALLVLIVSGTFFFYLIGCVATNHTLATRSRRSKIRKEDTTAREKTREEKKPQDEQEQHVHFSSKNDYYLYSPNHTLVSSSSSSPKESSTSSTSPPTPALPPPLPSLQPPSPHPSSLSPAPTLPPVALRFIPLKRVIPTQAQQNTWTAFWAERVIENFELLTGLLEEVVPQRQKTREQKEIWRVGCTTMIHHWKNVVRTAQSGHHHLSTKRYLQPAWIDATRRWILYAQKQLRLGSKADTSWPHLHTHMITKVERLIRLRSLVPTVLEALLEWSQHHLETQELLIGHLHHYHHHLTFTKKQMHNNLRHVAAGQQLGLSKMFLLVRSMSVAELKIIRDELIFLSHRFHKFRATLSEVSHSSLQQYEFLHLSRDYQSILARITPDSSTLSTNDRTKAQLLGLHYLRCELKDVKWAAAFIESLPLS